MRIKKILLSTGVVATTIAPVAVTVSCFGNEKAGPVNYAKLFANKVVPENWEWPEGIEVIRESMFYRATLPKNFSIPSTVNKIEAGAFYHAKNLPKNFKIHEGIKEIGNYTFSGCTLPIGFSLPKSLEKVGESLFKKTTFSSDFTWPEQLTTIPKGTFEQIGFKAFVDDETLSKYLEIVKTKTYDNDDKGPGYYLSNGLYELKSATTWQFANEKYFDISRNPKNNITKGGIILSPKLEVVGENAFRSAFLPDGFRLEGKDFKIQAISSLYGHIDIIHRRSFINSAKRNGNASKFHYISDVTDFQNGTNYGNRYDEDFWRINYGNRHDVNAIMKEPRILNSTDD